MDGDLHIYQGPMKSGKTLQLIHQIDSAKRNGIGSLALQPEKDLRTPGRITTRMSDGNGGETLIWREADDRVNTLKDVDVSGILSVFIDEFWMLGQAASRAEAYQNARREAQVLFQWLKEGIDVYVTTLNRLGNTNIPPMLLAVHPFEPLIQNFDADCAGDGCREKALYTALYDSGMKRIPISKLPDYVPEESLDDTPDKPTNYRPLCKLHFYEEIDARDLAGLDY